MTKRKLTRAEMVKSLGPNKAKFRQADGSGGEAWWYEDGLGIDVYQHVSGSGTVTSARISWRAILEAAKRCGKATR